MNLTFREQSIVGWELVTADGTILNVDAAEDPELAVALRGKLPIVELLGSLSIQLLRSDGLAKNNSTSLP